MSAHKAEMLISGVVQGVGFRYFVYRIAQQLNLTGWVRNLPDGRVQAVAEGDRGPLEDLIKQLRVGPRFGTVTGVDVNWKEPTGKYRSFEIQG
jgi:acylphosphatase